MNNTGKADKAAGHVPGPQTQSIDLIGIDKSHAGKRTRSAGRTALMEAAADYHAEQRGYVPGCEMDDWLNSPR
ncbi:MAG: DUF2934 domain-containing protein [Nevskia sp.]|nr:DUF2934 domain-containing protein [Nevskia sp.]